MSEIRVPRRQSVVILGAGTQGRRLAYMWSSQGRPVHLVDLQEHQLQEGLQYVEQLRASITGSHGNWGKIMTSRPSSLKSILQDAWLVVECVPEKLPLKRQVIVELDEYAPEETIIASNSSSYGIPEILEGLTLRHNDRVEEFADPVLVRRLDWPPETSAIELMGHKETDPSLIDLLFKQCKAHGFTPFHVQRSSIGYLYNRIWAAIKRETLLALAEGVGTPQEIDAIFKDVLKTPKGPCEQMDVVGLDVVLDIEQHYADTRNNVPSEPREYLRKMIQNGQLGVKSGQGFYNYTGRQGPKAKL